MNENKSDVRHGQDPVPSERETERIKAEQARKLARVEEVNREAQRQRDNPLPRHRPPA